VTAMAAPVTAWLKPTETVEFRATLVAADAGDCETTVGRAAVVNVHTTLVMAVLPVAFAPDTVTV
jgi:hypothetical protein